MSSCYGKGSGPRTRQSGVSLIELMIALVIASILGIGLIQIFGSTRSAFNSNSALARAQENSRFAIGFIERDLRMAAHLGLSNEQGYMGSNIFNHLSTDGRSNSTTTPFLFRTHLSVQGYGFNGTEVLGGSYTMVNPPALAAGASAWTPALPGGGTDELGVNLAAEALAGSDVLLMRYLSAEHVSLSDVSADATVSGAVKLDGTILWDKAQSPDFLKDGGVYALTNYSRLSLFYVKPDTTGAASAALGGLNKTGWPAVGGAEGANEPNYGQGSSLYRYNVVIYYVAKGADEQPALVRRRLGSNGTLGAREELVPGVDMMQVTYGVVDSLTRQGDRPTRYLAATGIENGTWRAKSDERWADVVSVRVGLLMRSSLPSASSLETDLVRDVGGLTVTAPDDRRLRHVYETQVALRNRSRG